MSSPFLGQIIPVPFNFPPKHWALCNGQTLAINQNTALFSLLGTTYGGNGQTTFQLPDLQGRVAVHAGVASTGSTYTLGEKGGQEAVQLTVGEIAAHAHQATPAASKDEQTTNRPDSAYFTAGGAYGSSADTTMGGTQTSFAGGSQVHPNLQPSLAMTFVIALTGIFPTRT